MPKRVNSLPFAIGVAAFATSPAAGAAEWSGDIGFDYRAFLHAPADPQQHQGNASLRLAAEFFHDWDDDRQRLVFAPFLRLDEGDAERSHFDLREFYWRRSFDAAELYVGLRRVYWGVTESAHLVDTINQTDLVENIDNEDKLGQPMIALRLLRDLGTIDLYVMPWFRERTFAGRRGRLRAPLHVDEAAARYESGAEESHLDLALRWSHYFGDWDIGVAHFSGTSREPSLLLGHDERLAPVLIPFYEQIEQTSLDVQATLGDWLWKLEAFHRTGQGPGFEALAAGFERTLVGLAGTPVDVGLIAEYLHDNRKTGTAVFDDDLALGVRLAFNDVQSTQLLAFSGIDMGTRERFTSIEASRRLGQSWTFGLEGRFFSNTAADSPLAALRDDDYLELSLARYF